MNNPLLVKIWCVKGEYLKDASSATDNERHYDYLISDWLRSHDESFRCPRCDQDIIVNIMARRRKPRVEIVDPSREASYRHFRHPSIERPKHSLRFVRGSLNKALEVTLGLWCFQKGYAGPISILGDQRIVSEWRIAPVTFVYQPGPLGEKFERKQCPTCKASLDFSFDNTIFMYHPGHTTVGYSGSFKEVHQLEEWPVPAGAKPSITRRSLFILLCEKCGTRMPDNYKAWACPNCGTYIGLGFLLISIVISLTLIALSFLFKSDSIIGLLLRWGGLAPLFFPISFLWEYFKKRAQRKSKN